MDRSIQPSLLIVGCAALITTAVLLPALVLRPSMHAASANAPAGKQGPITPIISGPVAPIVSGAVKAASQDTSVFDADASRGQRFALLQRQAIKTLGPEQLSAALPKAFAFPHARDDAIFGIDVSHHNSSGCDCDIKWDRVAQQKVAFVYVKSSEGTRAKDSQFKGSWNELAKIPNVYRGAYHFLSADDDVEEQVEFFLKQIGPLRVNDLPPAMDLEWDIYPGGRKFTPVDKDDYWANLSSEEIIKRALKFLELVEKKTGRTPVVYTSREWWRGRIGDEKEFERFKRYPLWLSAMANNDLRLEQPNASRGKAGKWSDWDLWQFTKMGDLTAANVPLPKKASDDRFDVSLFPGSLADFQKRFGLVPAIVVSSNTTTTPTAKPADAGLAQPKEPLKDDQAAKSSDAAKPGNDTIATPGPGGGTGAAQEPPKDKVATGPAADSGTSKPEDSNHVKDPAASSATVAPKRPSRPRPPRTTKQPANEAQVSSNPETDNTGRLSEVEIAKAPDSSGTPQEAKTQPPATNNPETDNTAKPSESEVAKAPTAGGEPTDKETAKDPQVAATTEPPKEAPDAVRADNAVKPEPEKKDVQTAAPVSPSEPAKEPQTAGPVTPSEPAKEPQTAGPVTTSEPAKEPQTAGTVSPSEPQKDPQLPSTVLPNPPPKETQVIRMPGADGSPGTPAEPSVAANPATGGTASASEPAKEPQVAASPVPDSSAAKPAEPNVAANPAAGGTASASEPAKEPQVAASPAPDSSTAKPAEPSVAANPAAGGTASASEPAKEPQVAASPAPDTSAAKPAEPSVAANPTTGGTASASEPAKEPQVAASPAPDTSAAKPAEPSVAANPTTGGTTSASEPVKDKDIQVALADKSASAGAPPRDSKVEANPAGPGPDETAATPDNKNAQADPQKPMMEIVLKNGRVLRVEADTDPDKLLRLIALLERS